MGRATPWRALLRSRNLYAAAPTYLIEQLGSSLFAGALFAARRCRFCWLASPISWAAGSPIICAARAGLRPGRCHLDFAAFLACATLVFSSTLPVPSIAKAVFLAFALAATDLALGACRAVPIDIVSDHAGVITGCMNTLGNLGGLIGPLIVGVAVDR